MIGKARLGSERGFTLLEMMVALVVFALIGVAIYQVLVHTNQSEEVGSSVSEAQQNARAALDLILRDLRQAGYGIDNSTNVPIETASQYRVTFVLDQNDNGTVDPGSGSPTSWTTTPPTRWSPPPPIPTTTCSGG